MVHHGRPAAKSKSARAAPICERTPRAGNMYFAEDSSSRRAVGIFACRAMSEDHCATSVTLRVVRRGDGERYEAAAEASLPLARRLVMEVPADVLDALRHVGDGEPTASASDDFDSSSAMSTLLQWISTVSSLATFGLSAHLGLSKESTPAARWRFF